MQYLPHTEQDRKIMLDRIGVQSVEELFAGIPEEVKFNGTLNLPGPFSELELVRHVTEMAAKNISLDRLVSFAGGGVYDHFVPSVVDHVLRRGELFTAYTPYQAEISQGTLQAIYEYQTMIAKLTGMDAANASMYDGATSLAEAALMAVNTRKNRSKILLASTINPRYLDVIQTYFRGRSGLSLCLVPAANGGIDPDELKKMIDTQTAALLVQQPNFFGCIEDFREAGQLCQDSGAALVVCADPISLGMLKPPGELGAEIVVGEGQALGNAPSWGGPGLGFFAARKKYLRSMPGRIAGATVDAAGQRGFALTLQTREQHIRREKATSNICSNQALNALAAAVFLSLLGKSGVVEMADLCFQKSQYAAEKIFSLPGFKPAFSRPFFKEFTVECPLPAGEIISRLIPQGILAGVDLGRSHPSMRKYLLVAVTEKRSRAEIETLAAEMEGLS